MGSLETSSELPSWGDLARVVGRKTFRAIVRHMVAKNSLEAHMEYLRLQKELAEGEVYESPEEPELRVEVVSPVVNLNIGERQLEANYANTCVYLFPKHDFMDHVYIEPENGHGVVIYNSQEVIDELMARDFPCLINPVPPGDEFESYITFQNNRLETDLSQ